MKVRKYANNLLYEFYKNLYPTQYKEIVNEKGKILIIKRKEDK